MQRTQLYYGVDQKYRRPGIINTGFRQLGSVLIQFPMKWTTKVDERTKEKIELLYKQFDRFIEENHSSSNQEDASVIKQWAGFKQVIEKNPIDFETMHTYISKIGQEEEKDTNPRQNRSSSPYSPGLKATNLDKKTELNKVRLKKVSNDLLAAIGRNNKELFKV